MTTYQAVLLDQDLREYLSKKATDPNQSFDELAREYLLPAELQDWLECQRILSKEATE